MALILARVGSAGEGRFRVAEETLEFTRTAVGNDDVHDRRSRTLRRPQAFGLAVAGIAGVAVALRVLLMVGYAPAILYYPDEQSYVFAAARNLFRNPFRPAGYSLFLRFVHLFSSDLAVTVGVQHALGLLNAVLAYAIARRIRTGRWWALAAAAIIVLSGDQLYLEHIVLSDGLFLTILLLVCYCGLRVRTATAPWHQFGWALASGVLTGALVTVRTAGLVAAGVLVLWLFMAGGPDWRRRVTTAGTAGLVCAALLLSYAFAQEGATGVFGLSRFSGWPLYGRVAPFANCANFTPPAGTAGLCEHTPSSQRDGPLHYIWGHGSPARRVFGPPPRGGAKVGAFARSAILAQPADYLFDVFRDLARYVDPRISLPPTWGGGPNAVLLNRRQPVTQAINLRVIRPYYGRFTPSVNRGIVDVLTTWQRIVRTHGSMIGLALILALAGILFVRDRATRAGLALVLASAVVVLVFSTMVSDYDYRYAIPAAALLMVAGARGAEVLVIRARSRHRLRGASGG